jgi:hypothetical protein
VKGTLSTSQAYTKDNDFLELKEKFDNIVINFIQQGTEVMTDWAKLNIQKLLKDRCISIFKKALHILDGIVSSHSDLLGTPTWPSVPPQNLTLFLAKLYLSNRYLDISELIRYLEVPNNTMQLICSQSLLHKTSINDAQSLLDSLSLSNIDMSNVKQKSFIFEALIQFYQIMKITTADVWQHYINKLKQQTAASKLEAKMNAVETITTSASTALAIANATETTEELQTQSQHTTLRLSNLKRALKRQEQKTNKVSNAMKSRTKKSQKNFNGGRKTEPAASTDPQPPTQHPQQKTRQHLVDLTKKRKKMLQSLHPSPQCKEGKTNNAYKGAKRGYQR